MGVALILNRHGLCPREFVSSNERLSPKPGLAEGLSVVVVAQPAAAATIERVITMSDKPFTMAPPFLRRAADDRATALP